MATARQLEATFWKCYRKAMKSEEEEEKKGDDNEFKSLFNFITKNVFQRRTVQDTGTTYTSLHCY
jgi:hypothetical protein